ncbi:hypothetical protein ACFFRR_006165 [Megaselia abdita]
MSRIDESVPNTYSACNYSPLDDFDFHEESIVSTDGSHDSTISSEIEESSEPTIRRSERLAAERLTRQDWSLKAIRKEKESISTSKLLQLVLYSLLQMKERWNLFIKWMFLEGRNFFEDTRKS